MIRIAVLDDQESYIEQIHEITANSMQHRGIVYEECDYLKAEDLLADLEKQEYFDIYLLDIEMPDYSGMEIAKRIRNNYSEPVIIYITNHVEFAVEAFEVNAYRYIPKSMLEEKLPEAYMTLYTQIEGREKLYYTIEKSYQLERIPHNEIYYLKKENKYVRIIHKRGESKVRKTLAELLEELNGKQSFLIIDRSYAVNIQHIMSLEKNQIILRNGSKLPISQPRLSRVKKEVMKYWRS